MNEMNKEDYSILDHFRYFLEMEEALGDFNGIKNMSKKDLVEKAIEFQKYFKDKEN